MAEAAELTLKLLKLGQGERLSCRQGEDRGHNRAVPRRSVAGRSQGEDGGPESHTCEGPKGTRHGDRAEGGAALTMTRNPNLARMAALKARRKRAIAWAANLAPIIAEMRANGVTSLYGIAQALNRRGIPTATGRGKWEIPQVRRVLERLAQIKA
jgi:hypothetical protein